MSYLTFLEFVELITETKKPVLKTTIARLRGTKHDAHIRDFIRSRRHIRFQVRPGEIQFIKPKTNDALK